MQPVAELAFLHVADEAVDAGDRLGRAGGGVDAEIPLDAEAARLVADIGHEPVAAARVKPVGI